MTDDRALHFITTDAHMPTFLESPKSDTAALATIIASFPNLLPLTPIISYLSDLGSMKATVVNTT